MNRDDARGAAVGLPARLLRLHEHSRANLLIVGGTRAKRLAVARAFHHCSPLGREALVIVECAKDEDSLATWLEGWLLSSAGGVPDRPPRERIGVLYLEGVTALSSQTQRLLLLVAHRLQSQAPDKRPPGPARLMAGARADSVRAAEAGRPSGALLDHLDKIRVEIGRRRSRSAA